MQRILILALLVLAFGLGAAFSYHNPQAVELNYLVGTTQQPLGALLMVVAAGAVVFLVALYWLLSLPRRAELARLRRRVEKAETELANLRKLPLKDG